MSKRTIKLLAALKRFSEGMRTILMGVGDYSPTSAAYIAEKRKKIDEQIAIIKKRWKSYAAKEIAEQYDDAASLAGNFFAGLKRAGQPYQKTAARMLENQVVLDFFEGIENGRKNSLRYLMETQQQAIKDSNITAAIRQGLTGGTPKSVKSEVLKALEKGIKDEKFITINGRKYQVDKYAELVARTRLREVQSIATIQSTLDYGGDLVRISDHGDTDPKCGRFAGRVFSITGNTKGYDRLTEFPPFHPRCLHVLTPFRPPVPGGEREKIINAQLDKFDKRAAEIEKAIKEGGSDGLQKLANKHGREQAAKRAAIVKRVKTPNGDRYRIVKDGEKRSGLMRTKSAANRRADKILFEDAKKV